MDDQSGYQVTGAGARSYECFAEQYMGQWAPDLIECAELHPGERVLDLACGTGLLARLAAGRVGPNGSVTGLDINAEMLAVARARQSQTEAAVSGSVRPVSVNRSVLPVCRQGSYRPAVVLHLVLL